MSKKPKRSRHRIPSFVFSQPDEITPEYQAEIDRSMERLAREFEKARKAAEAAERRKDRALRNAVAAEADRARGAERKKARRDYERRLAEYESAYEEFKRVERMMQAPPVKDRSRRGERVFMTSGRENPRALSEPDEILK